MVRVEFSDYTAEQEQEREREEKRYDTTDADADADTNTSIDKIHDNVLNNVKEFQNHQEQRVKLLHDWQRTFRKYMDDYKTTPAPTLSSTHRHLNNNDITGNGNGLADKQSADLLQGYTEYCESTVTRNMNTINASIREILNNLNLAYKQLY